jgi:hypothetical protein
MCRRNESLTVTPRGGHRGAYYLQCLPTLHEEILRTRLLSLPFLGAFLTTTACTGTDPEAAIRAFVTAANSGDVVKQVSLMPTRERETYGGYVIDIWYPDAELAHFHLDSVVQAPEQRLGRDTVLYHAWGTEPNWARAPREDQRPGSFSSGVAPPRLTPEELSPAQVSALPRVTARRDFWLVREGREWKITAESDKLGPLYIALDSIHDRCGYSEDPRPCLSTARRIMPAAATLRIFPRENIQFTPREIIESAVFLDSLRIEETGSESMYGRRGTIFEWYVHNLSSKPVRTVGIRIVDSTGAVVSDDAFTLSVPAGGRKRGLEIVYNNFKPPYRYELESVDGIGEM